MKSILAIAIACCLMSGCGQGGDSTSDAGQEVIKSADKGGAQPSPNLPAPIAGGGQRSGKFQPGTPGSN